MKRITQILCWVVLGLLFSSDVLSYAGKDTTDAALCLRAFVGNIITFNKLFPQEKVYLHFDNTGYFMGETIWFKAYVWRTDRVKPASVSRILYVELLDAGGRIVETRKLKIKDGQANGDIKLDKIRYSGFYEVRAYTRYMTNWDYRGIFSRVFPVFDKPEKEGDYAQKRMLDLNDNYRLPSYREKKKETQGHLQAEFYPEGGHLVRGLESRIAFRFTGKDGRPCDTTAYLFDYTGRQIGKVRTVREGVGWFRLIPDSIPGYLAFSLKGNAEKFPLPSAENKGWTMEVDAVSDSDSVIFLVQKCRFPDGGMVGLSVMHNGQVTAFKELSCEEGACRLSFSTEQFPAGVGQATLFDQNGRIWSERLFFNYKGLLAGDSIRIKADSLVLSPCGKVRLEIKTQPNAIFSFSAADAGTMPTPNVGHLGTWLLLSSELQGYVAHPEYYFESADMTHRMAADLLMMVQGWRRYDWTVMSGNGRFEVRQPIEDKLYLYGKLNPVWKKNKTSDVEVSAYLYNEHGQSFKGVTRTDSLGFYFFDLPELDGKWEMVLKTSSEGKPRRYYVGISRHFSPRKRPLYPAETLYDGTSVVPNLVSEYQAIDSLPQSLLFYSPDTRLLSEVTVKEKRIYEDARAAWENEQNGSYGSYIYYDCEQAVEDVRDRAEEIPEFRDWLLRVNPFFGGDAISDGSSVSSQTDSDSGDTETESASTVDDSDLQSFLDNSKYKGKEILWVLNNAVPAESNAYSLRESNQKMPVFLDEIKSIYICEDPERYVSYSSDPRFQSRPPVVVFIYTQTQNVGKEKKGTRSTYFQGYNVPSVFEMNDYEVLPPMSDFRRTLYWNPDVRADESGSALVEFYNNSSCRNIYISAEGIAPDGNCIFYK